MTKEQESRYIIGPKKQWSKFGPFLAFTSFSRVTFSYILVEVLWLNEMIYSQVIIYYIYFP